MDPFLSGHRQCHVETVGSIAGTGASLELSREPSEAGSTLSTLDLLRRDLDVQQKRLAAMTGDMPPVGCVARQDKLLDETARQLLVFRRAFQEHKEEERAALQCVIRNQGYHQVQEQRLESAVIELRRGLHEQEQYQREQLDAAIAEAQDPSSFCNEFRALREDTLNSQTSHNEHQLAHASQYAEFLHTDQLSMSFDCLQNEIDRLRADNKAALAEQVAMLKKEFEAAYRAEQLADAMRNRVCALERSLVEVREEWTQKFTALHGSLFKDTVSAGVDGATEATLKSTLLHMPGCGRVIPASPEASAGLPIQTASAESPDVLLCRRLEDMSALVHCFDDRLATLEKTLDKTFSAQSRKLEEALSQSQRALQEVEESSCLSRAGHSISMTCLKDDLLDEVVTMGHRTEVSCVQESLAVTSEKLAAEATGLHAEFARAAASTELGREEILKLTKTNSRLASEISDVSRETSEFRSDLTDELGEERESRVLQAETLRMELAEAVVVLKTQFEEWMKLVGTMRAELTEVAKGAKSRPAQEFAAARDDIIGRVLCESRLEMSREFASFRDDVKQKQLADGYIAGAVSHEQLVARAVREARSEWSREVALLRSRVEELEVLRQVAALPAYHQSMLPSTIVDVSAEQESRSSINASTDGEKMQARLAALRAMDSMEAAAKKIARPCSDLRHLQTRGNKENTGNESM